MNALWLENRELALRNDVDVPSPPEGEALVRVRRAGICATDHGLVAGLYPFTGILGHEFVGVVEDGPERRRGERVVGEINATCGHCRMCRRDLGRHCSNRTVLGIVGRNGAFAEYLTLPVENLRVVPEAVSDAEAVFTEPLAAALEIQEQVHIEPGARVLVVGDGRLGQLVAQTLALTGCGLLVSGRHAGKLQYLADRGVETAMSNELEERVARDGAGSLRAAFDIAVECTGNESGLAAARAALRPRGTLVLKSTYPASPVVDATMLVVDEITVVGSRCGRFEPALRLLDKKLVDVSYLQDDCFPLAEGIAAFERSRERGVLKVAIDTTAS